MDSVGRASTLTPQLMFESQLYTSRTTAMVSALLVAAGHVHGEALSFRPAVHLPVGAQPVTVLIADVNKDGSNDILVANTGGASLSVFLNDGKGGFSQPNGSPFPAGPSPNDLALGDFNGDGIQDVAIANHGIQRVTVLLVLTRF